MKVVLDLLNNLASTTSNLIEEAHEKLDIYSRVRSAMREPELAFHSEQSAINASIEFAERKIEVERYMSQSEEHKRGYLEALEDVQRAIGQKDEKKTKITLTIFQFSAPPSDPDPKINKLIETAFHNLVKEREDYFNRIRERLQGSKRLGELAKHQLHEFGRGQCWSEIYRLPVE